MKELIIELNNLQQNTKGDLNVIKSINSEKALYPFSVENKLLSYYLTLGEITYERYLELTSEYCKRNKYLELFELAPRTYGQTWGEQHILELFPQFVKATKENVSSMYPSFDGEFDLWIDGIRVEVKACRANNTKEKGSLTSRAYLHSEAKNTKFKYHFQQIKPSCCDIFILIGTCRDELLYWVLTSEEVRMTGKLGSQHRNENTGITGREIYEGQIFMTEEELSPFRVSEKDILEVVCQKGKKNSL